MFKTLKNFFQMIISKFNTNLPEVDPTIKPSLENVALTSSAAMALSCQQGTKDAIKQMFIDTADEEFLLLHGAKDGVDRLQATKAEGFMAVNGVLTTVVPLNTECIWNGFSYFTTAETTVQNYNGNIDLSFSNNIVTAITESEHSLSSGLTLTIAGASQGDYNGEFEIIVIDENTFQYELEAVGLIADSGTYSSDYALLNIESELTGYNKNIESGASVSISVVDIESNGFVGLNGITGGYDIEDIEDYRARAKEARIAPLGENIPRMIISVRKIVGNTRVIVIRPVLDAVNGTRGQSGYLPLPGETVIYILRDNEKNIIPGAGILAQTKQQILDDGLWSSRQPEDALMVLAPIKQHLEITVTNLLPNTATMKNSFVPALKQFCRDTFLMKKAGDANTGILKLDDIKTAISNIKDSITGELVVDYDINLVADVTADYGYIISVDEGDIIFL